MVNSPMYASSMEFVIRLRALEGAAIRILDARFLDALAHLLSLLDLLRATLVHPRLHLLRRQTLQPALQGFGAAGALMGSVAGAHASAELHTRIAECRLHEADHPVAMVVVVGAGGAAIEGGRVLCVLRAVEVMVVTAMEAAESVVLVQHYAVLLGAGILLQVLEAVSLVGVPIEALPPLFLVPVGVGELLHTLFAAWADFGLRLLTALLDLVAGALAYFCVGGLLSRAVLVLLVVLVAFVFLVVSLGFFSVTLRE